MAKTTTRAPSRSLLRLMVGILAGRTSRLLRSPFAPRGLVLRTHEHYRDNKQLSPLFPSSWVRGEIRPCDRVSHFLCRTEAEAFLKFKVRRSMRMATAVVTDVDTPRRRRPFCKVTRTKRAREDFVTGTLRSLRQEFGRRSSLLCRVQDRIFIIAAPPQNTSIKAINWPIYCPCVTRWHSGDFVAVEPTPTLVNGRVRTFNPQIANLLAVRVFSPRLRLTFCSISP